MKMNATLFWVIIAVIAVSLSACEKEAHDGNPVGSVYEYEAVFSFEADEGISKIELEQSPDTWTWCPKAVVLPMQGVTEYTVPISAEQGTKFYYRLRAYYDAGGTEVSKTIVYKHN